MIARCLLFGLLLCSCARDPLGVEEPKQRGVVNPMNERGRRAYDQRARDCLEMPNAQACYDVGMNYELGLSGDEPDRAAALQYYDKACELEHDKEFCEAAERLRAKR